MLVRLAPAYAALSHSLSNRLSLLLWHLLAVPPSCAAPAALPTVKLALLSTLRSGAPEGRQQALAFCPEPLALASDKVELAATLAA